MAQSRLDIKIAAQRIECERLTAKLVTEEKILEALMDAKGSDVERPAVKRTRRTKAQIQADKLAKVVVHGKTNGKDGINQAAI